MGRAANTWDASLPGFGLRVTLTGVRTWTIRYLVFEASAGARRPDEDDTDGGRIAFVCAPPVVDPAQPGLEMGRLTREG